MLQLIGWLEDRKIREYEIHQRQHLYKDSNDYDKYLNEVKI